MVETTIFRGYRNGKEVWAIRKVYGSGDTSTDFICEVEPTKEIIQRYREEKNVYNHKRKKGGVLRRLFNSAKAHNSDLSCRE